jgi:anti-sigma factor RsiW
MNPECHTTQERFTDYLDRALALPEREAVEAHVARCGACRNALAMSRNLVSALEAVRPPELPEGYAERFAARLQATPEETPTRRRPLRVRWPATPAFLGWGRALAGVAAGVVLTLVFVAQHGPVPATVPARPAATPVAATGGDVLQPVHVPQGSDAVVQVLFDAARPVDGVAFAIELPPGVRMVADGEVVDLSHLEWEGSLAAGRNVLSIPVRGVLRGNWSVTASIRRGGGLREQSVDVLVNGA